MVKIKDTNTLEITKIPNKNKVRATLPTETINVVNYIGAPT